LSETKTIDAPPQDTAAVRAEYQQRLDAALAAVTAADAREDRIAPARMGVFVVGLVVLWLVAGAPGLPPWLLLVPVAAFVGLIAAHERLRRARERERRRIAFYERGFAHLDGTWRGSGEDGSEYLDAKHPYSEHLDVLGPGSLFQRVCAARTGPGRATLAAWLTAHAAPPAIRRRQEAVAELRPRLDLREQIALLGDTTARGQHLDALPEWGEAEGHGFSAGVLALAFALPVAVFVAGGLAIAGLLPWWPVLAVFAAEGLVLQRTRDAITATIGAAETSARDLELLAGFLRRIEMEHFRAPLLADLARTFGAGQERASRRIAALRRILDRNDAAKNQIFIPLAAVLLWWVHVAVALQKWRAHSGRELRAWLAAVGEMEALSSFAGLAYEHPQDPFPEIVDDGPVLDATGLGHPLLPDSSSIRNDVSLSDTTRVYVVSGSNMSGKSTWLRSIGSNVVLALAGATVRAERLRVSPIALGASIHVHDSLLDGESRFYAEVSRIAQVVEIGRGGDLPLLFLLDELFHGTNSRDRRTGAAAVVRALLRDGAIGLLTTHDLELARIAEDLDAHVTNVHFEDQFVDGRMTFDYRIRPGVVERSNALALMRAVGLDV